MYVCVCVCVCVYMCVYVCIFICRSFIKTHSTGVEQIPFREIWDAYRYAGSLKRALRALREP